MARFMMRRFGSVLPRPRVLDLGCGAGAQTLWLAMNSFVVDAVDASPAAVKRAKELVNRWVPFNGALFHVADARHLPFGDGIFDAVVDVCTIQHVVDDQEKAVAEAFRALKPGGWLFSMMASTDHSITAFGGMSAKAHGGSSIDSLFRRYSNCHIIASASEWRFIEEYQRSARAMMIAHWIVEAQKEESCSTVRK